MDSGRYGLEKHIFGCLNAKENMAFTQIRKALNNSLLYPSKTGA